MLLPSGHSNGDDHPLQKKRPQQLVRSPSPEFFLASSYTTASGLTAMQPELKAVAVESKMSISPQNNSETVSLDQPIYSESKTTNLSTFTVIDKDCGLADFNQQLETLQSQLKSGWTVHFGKEGRLYYCNHITQSSGWLPSNEDWIRLEQLPYGWERAVDSKGRLYYINHLNKTSTYETPECTKWDESPPEPRVVTLHRSSSLGFGFVAGSERPVIVRFVTQDGPSVNKLQPGDQIIAVNGEDVKEAPRDHVIGLVRACSSHVTLVVCQPANNLPPGRKSTLLSAGKRAKLRSRPNRVRFAESVCVNGAPLFPASAFSLGDICVPPMANVLKVFLENGQTKSFKYDATTTVQDVVKSLLDKLCLSSGEIFSLVLEHVKSLKRNKLTLLNPDESLARIAARPGAHKLRCLFRVTFAPTSSAELAQKDLNALDYFYMQCCNDVTLERFAPELQPEVALRLAALHMHQHALANNVSPSKLTVKVAEREFGLERFVPASLVEGMKRKELRRLISHFLKINAEMTGSSTKMLTQLQAKLHYLDIIASLPSYGAKCFSTNQREGVERVLLVSPRFGLSQISSARNSVPRPICSIEDFTHVLVNREDDVTSNVGIFMNGDQVVRFSMEDRDACEFSLVLAGYYRLLTGKTLSVDREREKYDDDNAPSYLSQHTVLPTSWSYLSCHQDKTRSINFLVSPPYHYTEQKLQYTVDKRVFDPMLSKEDFKEQHCDRNMNSADVVNSNHLQTKSHIIDVVTTDLDMHSVMATELLEEAKDSGISDISGGVNTFYAQCSSNNEITEAKNEQVLRRVQEMRKMVENSEQYLNEQEELSGEYYNQSKEFLTQSGKVWQNNILDNDTQLFVNNTTEFDSDCESLNSSKVSSSEDTPQSGNLKHSDSLLLLAEAINQDLNGITQGLNSINNSQQDLPLRKTSLSAISSPRPDRKIHGLGQLLSNLQTLGTDFSQSESDSESVNSPISSPKMNRSSALATSERSKSKQKFVYRSSFGLHSPEEGTFGMETKDYNLKEYLRQLKEMSNISGNNQEMDVSKKLSEIYGFQIRDGTIIESDLDLIDLRAIPPPKTPDELDAFSFLNTVPQGFDDSSLKKTNISELDGDLDKFLAKVVVGPPTQKSTPAKELTPEEIMSFIIPPPPNSISNINAKSEEMKIESIYSNSEFNEIKYSKGFNKSENSDGLASTQQQIIEYATVERKSKFLCCPKYKKDNDDSYNAMSEKINESDLKLPPRNQFVEKLPPGRPPKTTEMIQRYSPKKQAPAFANENNHANTSKYDSTSPEEMPPIIPPRVNAPNRNYEHNISAMVSDVPKKPPVPQPASRPSGLSSNPLTLSYPKNDSTSKQPIIKSHVIPAFSFISNGTQYQQKQTPLHNNFIFHNNSSVCPQSPEKRSQYSQLCSPQMTNKVHTSTPTIPCNRAPYNVKEKLIIKNGHVIDGYALLAKTDIAMAGLLVKLDQVAALCSAAQSAGGGSSINEDKFQRARNELTDQTLVLVTASKFLVIAMSDATLSNLPEHLTSCLTAIRRITELTQDITRHTSSPLQTRNIVLKVHDVASSFRELVCVQIGPIGAGQLALQAECLANVLATLLRSLRVFSP